MSASKEGVIETKGIVREALPNAMFRVELNSKREDKRIDEQECNYENKYISEHGCEHEDKKHIVLCTISGNLRMNYIKIIPGDEVSLEMSPYDLTRGRIVWRGKKTKNVDQSNKSKEGGKNYESKAISQENM